MPEMPNTGEHHRQAMFLARLDRFSVAHGAAGLDDCGDAGAGSLIDVVAEGKERIECQHRPVTAFAGFAHGNLHRINAAHLPGADAYYHAALAQHDGVALDVLAYQPGETQIAHFLLGGCAFGHDLELGEIIATPITVLHQQTTIDTAIISARGRC